MASSSSKRSKKIKDSDLDALTSKIICALAGGVCQGCRRAGTQQHHVFGKKTYPAVRWDIDNLLWLCFGCHIIKIHRRGAYEWSRDLCLCRIGKKRFKRLKDRSVKKGEKIDLTVLHKRLSDRYSHLLSGGSHRV